LLLAVEDAGKSYAPEEDPFAARVNLALDHDEPKKYREHGVAETN
jgi:hypothetical protein